MAEHSTLTGANLHEPKGADTATASQVYVANGAGSGVWTDTNAIEPAGAASAVIGSEYVSDGAGSGDWIRTQGWGQWVDSRTTVGTPTQNIATGVRTQWLCDGGTSIVVKNPSDLVSPLWNTTTNKIIPIAAFDTYHVRVAFTAENYAGTNPYLEFALDIGGGIGEIFHWTHDLRKGGAAVEHGFSFPVYTGATFLANGGTLYVTYTGTGSCDLYRNEIMITRESKNYV